MDTIFLAVCALVKILGLSCLTGLFIMLLLITVSTIRKMVQNWRDHHDIW